MKKKHKKLLAVLILACLVPLLASLFYFVWLQNDIAARIVYAAAKIFLLAWPLAAWVFVLKRPFPRVWIGDSKHLHALPLGLVVGLLIGGAAFLLMLTPLGRLIEAGSAPIRTKTAGLGVLKHYWLFAVFLSVIHSFLEEYYWRWFVYGRLRESCPILPSLLVAGFAFASHHVVVITQFYPGWLGVVLGLLVGVGGVIWCVMIEKQKTLAGAWVSHMIVDFAVLAVGWRLIA
jgi:hypothetical protein